MEFNRKETKALMNYLSFMSLVEIKEHELETIFLKLILEEANLTNLSGDVDKTNPEPEQAPTAFHVWLSVNNPNATIYHIKAVRLFKGLSLADARAWLAKYNPAGTTFSSNLRGPLATFVSLKDAQTEVQRAFAEFNINGVGGADVGYCIKDNNGKIYYS